MHYLILFHSCNVCLFCSPIFYILILILNQVSPPCVDAKVPAVLPPPPAELPQSLGTPRLHHPIVLGYPFLMHPMLWRSPPSSRPLARKFRHNPLPSPNHFKVRVMPLWHAFVVHLCCKFLWHAFVARFCCTPLWHAFVPRLDPSASPLNSRAVNTKVLEPPPPLFSPIFRQTYPLNYTKSPVHPLFMTPELQHTPP